MNLNLFPTNPDFSAGLGFLGYSIICFAVLGFVQSSAISGEIANKILYLGETLKENRLLIVSSILGVSFIYILPSLFFMKKLFDAKLRGILEYGVTTSRQSRAFFEKWVKGNISDSEKFLTDPDFSAHTDLNTIYDIIQKMRIIPIDTRKIIIVVLIIAAPYIPLSLVAFPASEVFEFIIKLFA